MQSRLRVRFDIDPKHLDCVVCIDDTLGFDGALNVPNEVSQTRCFFEGLLFGGRKHPCL